MLLSFALLSSGLLAVVNAHFQLQFPPPRGPFVQDDEPNFCDGYTNATTNRTLFPLSGGVFSMNSEHSEWTAGVLLSTGKAKSFSDFKQIKGFFQEKGEGIFCFPLSFDSPNATGLTSGENITIQIVFDGGDGALFQCADLTLSSNVTLSGSADHCSNGTSTNGTSTNGTSTNGTSTNGTSTNGTSTGSGSSSNSASAREVGSGLVTVAIVLAGLATGLSL